MSTTSSAGSTGTAAGLHAVLPDIPIFALMPPDVRTLVVASLEAVTYAFGQVVVREGDDADAFYVIVSGSARALKQADDGDEVPLDVLRKGDSFGFVELIEETPRVATIRASEELQALRLDRAVFRALLRSNPEIRRWFELPVRMHHLRHFLSTDSAFAGLSTQSLSLLLDGLEEVHVPQGRLIFREGDPPGPAYVIRSGRARAFSHNAAGGRDDRTFLRQGDVFGEASLFTGGTRVVSVDSLDDLTLLSIPPATFKRLLDGDADFRRRVEQRVSSYEYKDRARVPLDFADEILPAVSAVNVAPVLDTEAAAGAAPAEAPAESPLADTTFAKPSKRIRRFQHLYQLDEADCGAACLGMICRQFGRAVSLPYIRDLANTGVDGTSLAGIARAAEGVGLACRTIKASKSRLDDLPLPAIVHWEGLHWVVLWDVSKDKVKVADPALGNRTLPRAELEEQWSGYAALLAPTPALAEAPEVH